MPDHPRAPLLAPRNMLLVALSLSIGWGVRGNWGHEYGALIPGALSALAVAIVAGSSCWRRQAAYFGFFGALGWSFGGSMSYGKIIGMTLSGAAGEMAYGFLMLFVIGFLWGAVGGAGTVLAGRCRPRDLADFFPPLLAVFSAWFVWEYLLLPLLPAGSEDLLNWFDTDWVGVTILLIALLGYSAAARKWNDAHSLMLWMALGWWAAFLVLVAALDLHMTPPRSDNWAGSLGMTAAMAAWLLRRKMRDVARASLVAGAFAGSGFAIGGAVQALGRSTGVAANWWSLMEQSFGFISGIGIAVAMARIQPPANGKLDNAPRWTTGAAVAFLLLVMTYVNVAKNIEVVWKPNKILPETICRLPAAWWFNAAYGLVAALVIALIWRHHRSGLTLVPSTALGRTQALYVLVLWWILLGNLSRLTPFHEARLVTEGVIHVNACLATWLALTVRDE